MRGERVRSYYLGDEDVGADVEQTEHTSINLSRDQGADLGENVHIHVDVDEELAIK